ncbi:hypothetical protein [Cohnella sp. JJ-181]|uniref:hypothetical protein n=1 Tax=Cohnella rhizoplanae TaxID=2974897 RepID=UPI0022FFA48A|nr:hypothetical protein [Cohnella sp. JJ-181]CAI6045501.1 hypothetical protein COHCIP112018_01262 [Cohnella sp. JJ-181]
METYELASLQVKQGSDEWPVAFERARLFVIQNYGTFSWYIELDGMTQGDLLRHFAESLDIAVSVQAVSVGGKALGGDAYFHPNPQKQAAAIRGQGELVGYP